eukprot:1334257-Amorphochlora_amoeboformis.AAC.2
MQLAKTGRVRIGSWEVKGYVCSNPENCLRGGCVVSDLVNKKNLPSAHVACPPRCPDSRHPLPPCELRSLMSREQKIRMLISALRKQVLFRISAQDIRDGRLEEARKAFRDQGTRHKSPLETSGEVGASDQ